MEIKCSLNFNWLGKPKKDDDTGKMMYDGRPVSISHGWTNVQDDVKKILTMVTTDGVAIAPYLDPGCNGHRCGQNFVSHQVAMVDIDAGMRIEHLFENDFYNTFGYGFYVTSSHTSKNHKFRIIFVLEEPVYNLGDMVRLYKGLMVKFKYADVVCKDGCRLFYGTENPVIPPEFLENLLPPAAVNALIAIGQRIEDDVQAKVEAEQKKREESGYEDSLPDECERDAMLFALSKVSLCNYEKWREVGWSMYHSGFTFDQFCDVTIGVLMQKKNRSDCAAVWKDAKTYERTYGVLVNILKERQLYYVYINAVRECKKWKPENMEAMIMLKIKQEEERTRTIAENIRRRTV